jgi:NAD(P)-dependent dehydrogenase (short-subunit alcohol dehydrogenase family)
MATAIRTSDVVHALVHHDVAFADGIDCAVVTGASRGIGLTVARTPAAEGAYIVAGLRDASEERQQLVAAGQASAVRDDFASTTGPSQLIQAALDGGPIDILINNAGVVTPRTGGSGSVTDKQWASSLNLTLMAAVRTANASLPTSSSSTTALQRPHS